MNKKLLLILFCGLISLNQFAVQAQSIKPKQVIKDMKRVADWQIEHFRDVFGSSGKPHHPRDWTNAALYVGMIKWAELSGDDKYYEWLKKVGEQEEWSLHYRKYMADDLAVGQMYLELYRKYKDPKMLEPTQKHFDWIMENPSQQPITLDEYAHTERWTWCDALFMAPPVWAKLHSISGDPKYSKWMLEEYKATTKHLFDSEENLYYRDNSYIGELLNDRKIFWSRGNGWVYAGLTLLLDEYEKGSEEYSYFMKIYLKMTTKIVEIQTPKGHWAMSLLAQDIYPTPETSGTAFFTYGLAWGINKGILDRVTYEPNVRKGWNALVSHIKKDGMLGYVQPIGAEPGEAWPDKTEVYGTGAFLSAGSEVFELYKK